MTWRNSISSARPRITAAGRDDSGVREAIEANLAALKLTQAAIRGDRATAEAAALIEESYRPHGEYMPALLPHLLNHLHRYE